MSQTSQNVHDISRYRTLGLITNPFTLPSEGEFDGANLEINSEANRLIGAISLARLEPSPKPIVVVKTTEMPSYYPLRSIAITEQTIVNSETLNVLHAYIPLFMMSLGRVRSTLRVVAERLAFRDFETTLACYVDHVLAEPDESLIGYQVLGEDGLAAFAERFAEDSAAMITEVFGQADIVERRPELTEVGDARSADLVADVEEEDALPEVDGTIADAPGTDVVLMEEADARDQEDPNQAIADYVVEYAKVHVSPVISRAIRVYRERGMQALANEFTITKAPRKTLAAVAKFARARFDKIVLIYDGFENWMSVPADLRTQISSTLNEIRWLLESDGLLVVMLEEGGVPELEEQFAGGNRQRWEFEGVVSIQESPDMLDADMVERWLARAALPDATPLSVREGALATLFEAAHGSLQLFVAKAGAAIESAAERGAESIDDEALRVGLSAEAAEAAS